MEFNFNGDCIFCIANWKQVYEKDENKITDHPVSTLSPLQPSHVAAFRSLRLLIGRGSKIFHQIFV